MVCFEMSWVTEPTYKIPAIPILNILAKEKIGENIKAENLKKFTRWKLTEYQNKNEKRK